MVHQKFIKTNTKYKKKSLIFNENLIDHFPKRRNFQPKFNTKFKFRKIKRINYKELDKYDRIRLGVNRGAAAAKKVEIRIFTNELDGRFLFQQFAIKRGKKCTAEKIAKNVLDNIKKKLKNKNHAKCFTSLIKRYRMLISFKSVKKAAMIHKVPVKLSRLKGMKKLVRLLIEQSRINHSKASIENYNEAIFSLKEGRGNVFKKRLEIHKLGLSGLPYLKFMKPKNN